MGKGLIAWRTRLEHARRIKVVLEEWKQEYLEHKNRVLKYLCQKQNFSDGKSAKQEALKRAAGKERTQNERDK